MDRSGQNRGVPEITPALPLFAQLRRYTLAALGAAETAANFAAVLESTAPVSVSDAVTEMDVLELEQRMATVLPEGWKLGQVKAEQPGTTYAEFKSELINEIARCLDLPYNIAAGNSSKYNYASGRLDHQSFFKSISIDRHDLKTTILKPMFKQWLNEAVLVEGFLPQSFRMTTARIKCEWMFDGQEHVDPQKEANAQAMRLKNFSTNYATEFSKAGKDWKKELTQASEEQKLLTSLGLTVEDAEKELSKSKAEKDDD
jgi:capsid protein